MGRGRKVKGEQTERTKIQDWLEKHSDGVGYQQFMDLINMGDKAQLEAKMLETAKYQQGLENVKNADEKLAEAKAQVAARNAHHKEDKAATQKRLRLLALAISERFGDAIMDIKPTAV